LKACRSIFRKGLDGHCCKNISLDTPIDKIAKKDAIMINTNVTLKDAAVLMVKHNIRHLLL
jgi:CBS domain-containing protein